MRMIISCVLCALLAMTCWAESKPAMDNTMLITAIKQLTKLNKTVKETDHLFHSPTSGFKDCCSRSALECFRSQLVHIPTTSKDLQTKILKNLQKSSIVTSIERCPQEQRETAKCQSCNSYPKVDSQEFLKNLLSLLQQQVKPDDETIRMCG